MEKGFGFATKCLEEYEKKLKAKAGPAPAGKAPAGKAPAGGPAAAGTAQMDPDEVSLLLLLSNVVADSRWVENQDARLIRKGIYEIKKKMGM